MLSTAILDAIEESMRDQGITIHELARRTLMTPTSLRRALRKRETSAHLATLDKIVDALRVDVEVTLRSNTK